VYERRDGLWVAEITRAGVVTRRSAATSELAEARLRVALGTAAPMRVSDPSVGDYLGEWVESSTKFGSRTRYGYRQLIEQHLVPSLGTIRVRELRAPSVRQMIAEMRAAGLKPGTQRNARNCLSSAMTDAIADGLIEYNPAQVQVSKPVNSAARVSIGLREAATLLEVIRDHPMRDLWALMLYTGGRLGETLGLDWSAVRLDDRKLAIRRQDTRVQDPDDPRRLIRGFADPKTSSGIREIPLAEEAVRMLMLRHRQMGYPRTGLIFPSARDPLKPINPSDAHHRFQDALKAGGHPLIRQHDLRHWCASLLIGKGMPITTVSQILGHRNSAITMSTYAHVITEAASHQVEILRFFPESPLVPEATGIMRPGARTPHEVGPNP
jgi:integrase